MSKIQIPELLAPAGSKQSLEAAINAGANAVYLSGKLFGARYYASNFSRSELKDAVDYAHLNRVKVYVTVNTLIKNGELQDVAEYLLWLYEIGVDAILVQDIGVAALAKELVPHLNLHASTQMSIHNFEGVKWAVKNGFKRVVLARELTLNEMEEIADNLGKEKIELEIFAHGALCYCYSGQCLLSSTIGGRSGNRGMCAQPCRKPYKLITGKRDRYGRPKDTHVIPTKGDYLLSPRDLATYNYLNRISYAPIDSIKIEGRMRSPEYVAAVVNTYRKALDAISNSRWKPSIEDLNDLKLAFNREFTEGYVMEADRNNIMSRDRPGNRGLYIGKVIDYKDKNKKVVIKLESSIVPEKGDGIVFISPDPRKREYGTSVHQNLSIDKNKMLLQTPHYIKPGTSVYLTKHKAFTEKIKKIITTNARPKIPINLKVKFDEDNTPLLHGEFPGPDKKLIKVNLRAKFSMEKAISRPMTTNQIEAQFCKTGGTRFNIKSINIQYQGNLFAPIGKINELRREFLKKSENRLLESYRPNTDEINTAKERFNVIKRKLAHSSKKVHEVVDNLPDLAVYVDNLENVKAAVYGGCNCIYFEPLLESIFENCLNDEITLENMIYKVFNQLIKAKSFCDNVDINLIWKWPHITRRSYLDAITPLLTPAFENGIKEVMVDDIGAEEAILNIEPRMRLSGAVGINIWNHSTVDQLSSTFKTLTLSPELSKEEIKTIIANVHNADISITLELMIQGNLETMVSEDCLPCTAVKYDDLRKAIQSGMEFWGLQDFKKRIFPISLDNECKTHILNSVELCLIDHMQELVEVGLNYIVVDARGKTSQYTHDMVTIYHLAIEHASKKSLKSDDNLIALKNKIKKISAGGITMGNFIRGIKEE